MSRFLITALCALVLVGTVSSVDARPKKPSTARKRPKKEVKEPEAPVAAKKPANPEQGEADAHFRSGVTLYKEGKYAEALAEFERAYEIAPHPLVLYNIAGCHRELSNYAESIKYSQRFLEEGKGVVPKSRLATAQTELDAVLARIARVTVSVEGAEGAELSLDGESLGTLPLDMPLVLAPGEHRLVASAEGYRAAERALRVASGDEVEIELKLSELPKKAPEKIIETDPEEEVVETARPRKSARRMFALGAGFGTNLRRIRDTGAPSARLDIALGSRLEVGVEGVFVAYAVIPSVRLRLLGDRLSTHLVGAMPIAFSTGATGSMSGTRKTFVAGGGGLGFRYRATPALAFRLEAFASFAGKAHGTTFPAFFGGELWF
jgi:tetratricopeptide (TPR) repeat protein